MLLDTESPSHSPRVTSSASSNPPPPLSAPEEWEESGMYNGASE